MVGKMFAIFQLPTTEISFSDVIIELACKLAAQLYPSELRLDIILLSWSCCWYKDKKKSANSIRVSSVDIRLW